MTWTDRRIEMLRKLWDEGLSCSMIAGELGGITRNAVIGKADRLGLPRRRHQHEGPPRLARPKRNFGFIQRNNPDVKPVPFVPRAADVVPLNLGVLQLSDAKCRFPYGDHLEGVPYTFCGHSVKRDKPYCPAHCALVYQPITKRAKNDYSKALDRHKAARERHEKFGNVYLAAEVA